MNESQIISLVVSLIQIVVGTSGLCVSAYLLRRENREIDKRNHWKSKKTIDGGH